MKTFIDYGIDTKGKTSGQIKIKCPKCSHTRRKKTEPCLSVNIDDGAWTCWNCKWQGGLKEESTSHEYKIPTYTKAALSSSALNMIKSRGISQEIVEKHRMTQEKMWMPQSQKEEVCIVWNYFRDGHITNKKYRSASKGFRLEKDAELILYNIDSISDNPDYVIITEGEFDCMAYDQAGFDHVVSVPNGANLNTNNMGYLESCFELFKGIKKIYLAVDADEAGQSLMQELGRRLGFEKCFKVSYPEKCKDGNQTLVDHGEEALKKTIEKAKPFPIKGVIMVEDSREDLRKLYHSGMVRGVELQEFGSSFVANCTFKTSLMYTVTGIPTHGKSTVVNNWEILLAAKHGWKCGIFSPEHYPLEYFISKYCEILVGQPFFDGKNQRMSEMTMDKAVDFINDHFFIVRPEGDEFTLDKILEAGRQLVFRHGIKVFTIDPWNNIHHDFQGMTETQYIERSLLRLTRFKQANDLLLFLIAHPKKMTKDASGQFEVPSLYDISGSSNFYNMTDIGITIYRDREEKLTNIYVQKCKYKNIGKEDFTRHQYDALCDRVSNPEGHPLERRNWLPEMNQSFFEFDGFTRNNESKLPF